MKNFEFFLLAFVLIFSVGFVSSAVINSDSGSLNVNKQNSGFVNVGPNVPDPCGNNILELSYNEQCDGSNLGGQSCSSLNQGNSGTLSCTSQCTYDTSDCSFVTESSSSGGSSGGSGGGGSSGGGSSGGSGGGGSSGTTSSSGTCIEDWSCSEWGSCIDGLQTRTCNDNNVCATSLIKPSESRECVLEDSSSNSQGFWSGITGAAIGAGANSWLPFVLLVLVLIGLWWWLVGFKKK